MGVPTVDQVPEIGAGPTRRTFAIGARWAAALLLTAAVQAADDGLTIALGSELNGAWFNPDTPGQGFMLDVADANGLVFLAWFTFDDDLVKFGAEGQRWFTVQGAAGADGGAEATIFQTEGGAFDAPTMVSHEPVGSARLWFSGCNNGQLDYRFDDGPSAGSIPLRRLLEVEESRCGALVPATEPPPEVGSEQAIALVGATVLPMDGTGPLPNHTVIVRDGRVQGVAPRGAIPVEDALVIDARNRFLMPGLADLHTHLATNVRELGGPGVSEATIEESARNQLMLYLANGVTTIVNNGDFGEPLPRWAGEVRAGSLVGPTIYSAQYARGGAGTCDRGPLVRTVTTASQARGYVSDARDAGYDLIKIYNCTPPDAAVAILEEAGRLGMPVIGHFPRDVGAEQSLERGMAAVAHMEAYVWTLFDQVENPALIPAAIDMTLRNDASVITTLSIAELIALVWGANPAGTAAYWARPENVYMHPTTEALNQRSITSGRFGAPGSAPGGNDARLEFVQRLLRDFHAAGVPLMMGTDSPTVLGVPGFSAHDELEALARAGLEREAVLATATRNPGRFISERLGSVDGFGTVVAGQRADLILLEADPFQDVTATRRIAGVMARGHWRSRAWFEPELAAIAASYGH